MAHYAKVNEGIVEQVIVADEDFFKTFVDDSPGEWIQTSYNTRGGKHILDGTPLRYNFAGVGYHYDSEADAFYEPKPFKAWVLDTKTYTWNPPTDMPDDGKNYRWDDDSDSWKEIEDEQPKGD